MQWLIDIIVERVIATIGIPPVFINRGDPVPWDWTQADLTFDSTWRDLDLSAIVPSGAQAVLFNVSIVDVNVNRDFLLREKGNVNTKNMSPLTTEVANIWKKADRVCPCNEDRFVQYFSDLGFLGQTQICVKGWWL